MEFRVLHCGCFNLAVEFAGSEGEKAIAADSFSSGPCHLEQLDGLGLGPMENKYLAILKDGPTRLNVIASFLGLPTRTVSNRDRAIPDSCGPHRQEQGRPAGTHRPWPRTRFEEMKMEEIESSDQHCRHGPDGRAVQGQILSTHGDDLPLACLLVVKSASIL